MRAEIANIRCPTLLLMGEKDMLTPAQAGEETVRMLTHGHLKIISGAGHAPFLSHPEQLIESITTFIHE